MQTFVPYGTDFAASARCLDRQRLGKQRVEGLQILKALGNPRYGWQNHPAVRMWRDYSPCLALYTDHICAEWIERGYNDTIRPRLGVYMDGPIVLPLWLYDTSVALSHQSNLLRKDPEWYGQFGWAVPDDLPYVWPV